MKKEIKSILKKTTKIACVTCVATGAIAVMTSGVALKAIGEGGKYLVNTIKKIASGADEADIQSEDTPVPKTDFVAPSSSTEA